MKNLAICIGVGAALALCPAPAGVAPKAWNLLAIFTGEAAAAQFTVGSHQRTRRQGRSLGRAGAPPTCRPVPRLRPGG